MVAVSSTCYAAVQLILCIVVSHAVGTSLDNLSLIVKVALSPLLKSKYTI